MHWLDFVPAIIACGIVILILNMFFVNGNTFPVDIGDPFEEQNPGGTISVFVEDPLCTEADTFTIGCGGNFISIPEFWDYVQDMETSLHGDVVLIQVSDIPSKYFEFPEDFWDKNKLKSITYQNFTDTIESHGY